MVITHVERGLVETQVRCKTRGEGYRPRHFLLILSRRTVLLCNAASPHSPLLSFSLSSFILELQTTLLQPHQSVKEQQYGQHGLVYVTVADALIEQEAGVPDHRIQGVLPHDVIDFVCIQVLVHELVAELAEVTDSGTGGAPWQCPRRTEALTQTSTGHGVINTIGQV